MSNVLNQKENRIPAKFLVDNINPIEWTWKEGVAEVVFSNGQIATGSCLRCPDMPCIEYRQDELSIPSIKDFPLDRDNNVCPTKAIVWHLGDTAPSVDPDNCIRCGLCVTRCPIGAIHFDFENGPRVNDEENAAFGISKAIVSIEEVETIRQKFHIIEKQEAIIRESDQGLEVLHSKIETLLKTTPKLAQHLVRNVLIALGYQSAMRRVGDVNIRMEAVFSRDGLCGTVEVETGSGILDAPRNIMDNVAVLVSRYGFEMDQIASLIVALNLPNRRTDYWNVIKDIKSVLGLEIGIVSITGLLLLVWNQKTVSISNDDGSNIFYADADSHSIQDPIEKIIERKVDFDLEKFAVLEPRK